MRSALTTTDATRDKESEQLEALTADLRLLDGRLQHAVEKLRGQIPEDADPAHRGLIIGEEDVDTWLSNLGEEGKAAPLTGVRFHPDGRLSTLAATFDLNSFEQEFVLTALAPEI